MPKGIANTPEAEAERRRKIGESSRGRKSPKSPETRRKIAETLRGRKLSPEQVAAITKANRDPVRREAASRVAAADWERKRQEGGKPLGYFGAHQRVRTARGPAKTYKCRCGRQAQHWAHLHGTDYTNVANYEAMCQRCHFRYDQVRLKALATTTPESRSASARAMWAKRSPEFREQIRDKAAATRRRKAERARDALAMDSPSSGNGDL